jgi:hypothetical protein
VPYTGLSLSGPANGSFVQYCRFQGFGYDAKSSPPYELGALATLRSEGLTIRRIEIDGRQAAEINPARPRSSGGMMWNKETKIAVVDSWLHHTRRSGWATNNQNGVVGTYSARNFQVEQIANVSEDGWPASPPGFNASNLEGISGTVTYDKVRFNGSVSGVHIQPANISVTPGWLYVNDPVVLDTLHDGFLYVNIPKTLNGVSPNLWYSDSVSGLRVTAKANGKSLLPVGLATYNANKSAYSPARNYLVGGGAK